MFHIIVNFFLAILVKLNDNLPFWLVICDVLAFRREVIPTQHSPH